MGVCVETLKRRKEKKNANKRLVDSDVIIGSREKGCMSVTSVFLESERSGERIGFCDDDDDDDVNLSSFFFYIRIQNNLTRRNMLRSSRSYPVFGYAFSKYFKEVIFRYSQYFYQVLGGKNYWKMTQKRDFVEIDLSLFLRSFETITRGYI